MFLAEVGSRHKHKKQQVQKYHMPCLFRKERCARQQVTCYGQIFVLFRSIASFVPMTCFRVSSLFELLRKEELVYDVMAFDV